MSVQKLSSLTYIFEKKKCQIGEIFFLEDDPYEDIYLVKKGSVELYKIVEVETEHGI